MNKIQIQIGVVSVDSSQIMITDPGYIDIAWVNNIDDLGTFSNNPIYLHEDGTYWQSTYNKNKSLKYDKGGL